MCDHGRALRVQTWVLIVTSPALSSVPARTVTIAGLLSRWLGIGEPQSAQKKRYSVRPLSAFAA